MRCVSQVHVNFFQNSVIVVFQVPAKKVKQIIENVTRIFDLLTMSAFEIKKELSHRSKGHREAKEALKGAQKKGCRTNTYRERMTAEGFERRRHSQTR